MILLYIITSILYLLMMFFVISLYYIYHKDYEELEKRLLEIEKRDTMNTKYFTNCFMELYDMINEKEGDSMACKGKGKGGKRK